MAYSAYQYSGGILYPEHASQIVIDSSADLADINLDVVAPGTRVVDCSSGSMYILSPGKEWKLIQNNVAAASKSVVTESASGDIAVITDGANDVAVRGLTATITPVQSGSGDPSTTNIRPISGRTGLTVTAAGKNLLNPSLTYGLLSLTIGALETDITQSTRYGYTERFPSTSDIVLSMRSTDTTKCEYARIVQYVDGVVVALSQQINFANTSTWYTRTLTGIPNSYCRLVIGAAVSDCGDHIYGEGQVEFGTSATAYEPYTAQTFPITWQTEAGTIYGGTLNVTTGVLTVNGVLKTLTGDENFSLATNSRRFQKAFTTLGWERANTVLSTQNQSNSLCSHATYLTGATGTATPADYRITNDSSNAQAIVFYDTQTEFANAAAFNAYLAAQYANGTPVQLYYDLATPLDPIQLSPTEIRSLLGGNTVYTDVGAVSVTYVADTKKYIDNKIAELQALILEN